MEKKKSNQAVIGGVSFVGCMFIGLGLGMLFDHTVVGIMLGMGVGFIALGLSYAFACKRSSDN